MAETPDRAFSNAGKPRIGLPVGRFRTPREINKKNRLFWRKQSKLRDKRLADEEVLRVAGRRSPSEMRARLRSQTPIRRNESARQGSQLLKARFAE